MPISPRGLATFDRKTFRQDPLIFDRVSGQLFGASAFDRAAVVALQAGSVVAKSFGHRGYGIGCRAIGAVVAPREIVVRLNEDARFAMPFCDGYWSRLLNRGYHYEEEIEALLRAARQDRYTFVDCGANFGYWSVLASSRPFGPQQAIAIEASAANAQHLKRNADLNGNRFHCLHAAVGGRSGAFVRVTGTRDEKLETIRLAQAEPDSVETVSLDGLAEDGLIDTSLPLVIKLDVEGVEIEALDGAGGLLARDCVVICEEHGSDRTHAVSRHLTEKTLLKLFVFDPAFGHFAQLEEVSDLTRIKKHAWVGYNVFATSSSRWREKLLSATWSSR